MTEPKYKPILFAAPMVRAILEGSKTQTRRVVKHQPTESGLEWVTACEGNFAAWQDSGLMLDEHSEDGGPCQRICPYGQPGDRLWVKENFAAPHKFDAMPPRLIPSDANFYYSATDEIGGLIHRPSIFMPRWASRINLEITGVRVERVQDISEVDAKAEGVDFGHITDQFTGEIDCEATDSYENLWEQINGPDSWDKNPWVWVIEFKRM